MVRSLLHVKVPEPDTLKSSRKKRQAEEASAVPSEINHREIYSVVHTYPDSDVLTLDKQTLKDFQIFESDTGEKTLFEYCNYTRNKKGAKVLRARMQRPLSNPARILAVQDSVSFILGNFELFRHLPSHVITDLVENYVHGILPLATSHNAFEYIIEALEIRYGDVLRYDRIMRGVEATFSLIRALRDIVSFPELASSHGELAELLEEMRNLLAHPRFSIVTERKAWSLNFWKLLRIDQVFRIHEKHTVFRLLQLTYELDALLSLSITTRKHGLVMPQMDESTLHVQAEGVFHPLIDNAVANPVSLNQEQRLLFLTGPNMAGKTTYLRASGIALYFAHLGMGVPASTFRFSPAQRLFSAINLTDNLSIGVSYFRAEALRVKAIAQALAEGSRVIAIMDEPFKGTNVKDALDASLAVLLRFASRENSLFMFSSHLIEIREQTKMLDQMDCRYFEAEENSGPLSFDYILKKGVSNQRLGMRVLQEEGIFDLLDRKE